MYISYIYYIASGIKNKNLEISMKWVPHTTIKWYLFLWIIKKEYGTKHFENFREGFFSSRQNLLVSQKAVISASYSIP